MTEKPYGTFFGRSRSRWRLHRRAFGGEIQFQPFPCPISPSQHSEFHQDSSSSSFAQLENRAKRERKREPGSSLIHYPAEELQSLVCLSSSEVKDLFPSTKCIYYCGQVRGGPLVREVIQHAHFCIARHGA